MKRFLILSLATAGIFVVISSARAIESYNHIYCETVVTDHTTYNREKCDWTHYTVTADLPFDNFKFGFSASFGELEAYQDSLTTDFFNYHLKGGVPILNREHVRLDLTGGYLHTEYEYGSNSYLINHQSMFLGIDLRLILSERVWFDANYLRGLNPVVKTEINRVRADADMDSLEAANLRLNFLFLEDTALSLGYVYEGFNSLKNNPGTATLVKNKGYTLGLVSRF
ncbi:MAG TPA: hypothetical protein VIM29_13035 [Bacillota bacterium]